MAMNVSQFVSSDNFNMAEFNDMISQINSGVNSEVAALTTLINSGAKIQTGSYTGTGTYGESNPCSLTFDFVPRVIVFTNAITNGRGAGVYPSNSATANSIMSSIFNLYTTTYTLGFGFGTTNSYGKRSEDGKTIYWYSDDNAGNQLNYKNYTYYYFVIY